MTSVVKGVVRARASVVMWTVLGEHRANISTDSRSRGCTWSSSGIATAATEEREGTRGGVMGVAGAGTEGDEAAAAEPPYGVKSDGGS